MVISLHQTQGYINTIAKGVESKLITKVADEEQVLKEASENMKFACSVAEFGMPLRDSEYKSDSSFKSAEGLAKDSKIADLSDYRSEFIQMVKKAAKLYSE